MAEESTPNLTGEVETPVRWLIVAVFFFLISFGYLLGNRLAHENTPTSSTPTERVVDGGTGSTDNTPPKLFETDGFVESERIQPVDGNLPPPPLSQ
jgi:hypothetical protein